MTSYTLLLSRGTAYVSLEHGEKVLAAMADGKPSVVVDVDMLGDGFVRKNVRLSLAHVVAVLPHEDDSAAVDVVPYGPNVRALKSVRPAR